MTNWHNMQREIHRWQKRNFGECTSDQMLKGVVEEVGELNHFSLKREQKIRHTDEECVAGIKDSIGDIVIYLMQYCSIEGYNFEDIVGETAERVMGRDWNDHYEKIDKCVQKKENNELPT